MRRRDRTDFSNCLAVSVIGLGRVRACDCTLSCPSRRGVKMALALAFAAATLYQFLGLAPGIGAFAAGLPRCSAFQTLLPSNFTDEIEESNELTSPATENSYIPWRSIRTPRRHLVVFGQFIPIFFVITRMMSTCTR